MVATGLDYESNASLPLTILGRKETEPWLNNLQ